MTVGNRDVVLSPGGRHRERGVPVGLFFGVLYRRSGNLWIVAIFHAIGNAYIIWTLGPVR